jgi:hypothetical protein
MNRKFSYAFHPQLCLSSKIIVLTSPVGKAYKLQSVGAREVFIARVIKISLDHKIARRRIKLGFSSTSNVFVVWQLGHKAQPGGDLCDARF